MGALHDDAVRTLTSWRAPDASQARLQESFVDLLHERSDATLPEGPGRHLTASVLIVDAAAQRVLLCLHGRVGTWLQVGGHLEPDDQTLLDAARREALEETGIAGLTLHPVPVDLDIHPIRCRHGQSQHFDVRYAGIAPAGAIEQVSAESRALGWFAPDALPEPLGGGVEHLVTTALRAVRAGGPRPGA